jgi:hypothetical protein
VIILIILINLSTRRSHAINSGQVRSGTAECYLINAALYLPRTSKSGLSNDSAGKLHNKKETKYIKKNTTKKKKKKKKKKKQKKKRKEEKKSYSRYPLKLKFIRPPFPASLTSSLCPPENM